MKTRPTRLMPPLYFAMLFMASMGAFTVFDGVRAIIPPYSYAGIILAFVGAVMTIQADRQFKNNGTTVKPYEQPSYLEMAGPFRLSRNPMYLGFALILLGEAVFLGTTLTFLSPLIFVLICQVLYIPAEEKNLEASFGNEYLQYKRKVRRWL